MNGIILLLLIFLVIETALLFRILIVAKKGNKNQQEIKTRLHWLREGVNKLQEKFKVKG